MLDPCLHLQRELGDNGGQPVWTPMRQLLTFSGGRRSIKSHDTALAKRKEVPVRALGLLTTLLLFISWIFPEGR